ncbi:MAG TPA: hypothetical protein VKA35_09585 [Solirubrobacterales bacterium]|nr:hypothetical protein [Solirubrobacterales bacterium]
MSWRLTFLVAVAITAIAGVALAAQGGGSKSLVLCAAKKGGDLRLGSKGRCGKGERKLTISKQGPKGEPGATGLQGAPGGDAAVQVEPVRAVAPVSGSCVASPGTFCGNGGLDWTNADPFFESVGFWKDPSGIVHLEGTAQGSPGALGNDIFILPAGYRPAAERQFVVPTCLGEFKVLEIEADGAVHLPSMPNEPCISLDGVNFRP